MKKAAGQLGIILRAVLFIGFSIRIVLGLVWMVSHFVETQEFAQVSSGIYPLFARAVGLVPQVLYVLQLGAAFGAGWQLLKAFGVSDRLWRTWGASVLLTFPMAMQCHLALLPYSFVSSLVLLELGFCAQTMTENRLLSLTKLTKAGCCMLGLALLLPEYVWLGAIPLVFTVLLKLKAMWTQPKRLLYSCLLVAAFCGMLGGIGSLVHKGDSASRNLWFSIASRTAWPTFWVDSSGWSEGLYEAVGESAWEISIRPGDMEQILRPLLESKVGAEQAEEYYREMAVTAWERHKSRIFRQVFWDALIYGAPEAVLQMQLSGIGYDSLSGRNYEMMAMRHPIMTKFYVSYSSWWFWLSLGIAVLLLPVRFMAGDKLFLRRYLAFGTVAALWMAAIVLYYTMQGAGIADYKCTLAAGQLWYILVLAVCRRGV